MLYEIPRSVGPAPRSDPSSSNVDNEGSRVHRFVAFEIQAIRDAWNSEISPILLATSLLNAVCSAVALAVGPVGYFPSFIYTIL